MDIGLPQSSVEQNGFSQVLLMGQVVLVRLWIFDMVTNIKLKDSFYVIILFWKKKLQPAKRITVIGFYFFFYSFRCNRIKDIPMPNFNHFCASISWYDDTSPAAPPNLYCILCSIHLLPAIDIGRANCSCIYIAVLKWPY